MQHTYSGNICHLRLPLQQASSNSGVARLVENIRNCDVFVEDKNFLIYADVQLFRFHSPSRQFDIKDMKNLRIKFITKERCYELQLPCLPPPQATTAAGIDDEIVHVEKGALERKTPKAAAKAECSERGLNLWQLKRITEHCQLTVDNSVEALKFVADFDYGFARKFKGKIQPGESDLSAVSRMPEPHLCSPLQRSIDREIDEMKNFSRDQYKLNFVELQVPEGLDNPMKFCINFDDTKLSRDEECLLHNLTLKPEDLKMPAVFDPIEVDCGLISILLATCYDIRSTCNEPTCESAWTRSILSATLSYFEPFDSLKAVVISFLRRALIYPLYRNYDFGRLCVQDAIEALQKGPAWLLKQLLNTHELFASSECSRELLNRYYIEDYIRYVDNDAHCTGEHLQTLARNLKNVLLDVYKKHLQLDLGEIETELLKELITDIHIGAAASEESEEEDEGDDDNDNGTESGEDETETSSASETEENSVIEQRFDALKI